MDTALEVLKWVVLILLAGFIGQFGKSMSVRVIHYFQEKKKRNVPTVPVVDQVAVRQADPLSPGSDPKAEKKILKGQLKAQKKMGKLKGKGNTNH